MNDGRVSINLTGKWHQGTPYIRGTVFDGNQKLSLEEARKIIRDLDSEEAIVSFMRESNGFFSIVFCDGDTGWMAVDRIRSLPLFYGLYEGNLFISNNARWVREQVKDVEMDPLAREEFLLTGYVTGPDTLFPKIKQVQAGEVVFFGMKETGDIRVKPNRYYRYLHADHFEEDEETLRQKLDDVLVNIFDRLISYADGRTIMVPLSGGYDSRLIVLMLKRLGYDRAIAFSYGKPGNKEAQVSREVAGRLGIRWEFIPYSNELWYGWYRSPEMKAYFEFADGLASLPHIQDWPAVWILKQEKRIPDDALFVPGHTTVLSIQIGAVEKIWRRIKGESCFFEMLRQVHYRLKETREKYYLTRNRYYSDNYLLDTKEQVASVGDLWGWTERQSKFICNSIRAYEFFGYEWWMPLWDREFVAYYEKMPYALRLGKRFYVDYIRKLFADEVDLPLEESPWNAGDRTPIQKRMISTIKRILPGSMEKWVRKERNIHCFKNNPMGWYGIHDDEYIAKQIRNGATIINSILAMGYLDDVQKNISSNE